MLVWSNAAGYLEFVPFDDKEQRWPLLNTKKHWLEFTCSGGTAGSLEHQYQATHRHCGPQVPEIPMHRRRGVPDTAPQKRPFACHPKSSA